MKKALLFVCSMALTIGLVTGCGKQTSSRSTEIVSGVAALAQKEKNETVVPKTEEKTKLEEKVKTEENAKTEADEMKLAGTGNQGDTATGSEESGSTEFIETPSGGQTIAEPEEIIGGSSQADAVQLSLHKKIYSFVADGQNTYFAFHTGAAGDGIYQVTVTDKTFADAKLAFYVFDQKGTEIASSSAFKYGISSTIRMEELKPDADYYIRLVAENETNNGINKAAIEFALTIRDSAMDEEHAAASYMQETAGDPDAMLMIYPGSNQDEAAWIANDITIENLVSDGMSDWIAFTTGNTAGDYQISVTDKSPDHSKIAFHIFDCLGNEMGSNAAYNNGITATSNLAELTADTTYYIQLLAENERNSGVAKGVSLEYALTVYAPEMNAAVSLNEEVADIGETEIKGGGSQADAVQLPLNTKVYGSVADSQNTYFAFHTDADQHHDYQITVTNKTFTDARLGFYVFDQKGTEISSGSAFKYGISSTVSMEDLAPDTNYYIRLIAQNETNSGLNQAAMKFALIIRHETEQMEGLGTTSSLVEAVAAPDTVEQIIPGSNQDDAALIPNDTVFEDAVSDGMSDWIAFSTGSTEGTYQISVIDKSPDRRKVAFYIFDCLGDELGKSAARRDGIAATLSLSELTANTTYYIQLLAENETNNGVAKEISLDYALTVYAPNEPAASVTAKTEEAQVFETPFELTATQVRFVANQAVFIDEEAAKESLAPVAEIILAHPGHPILLAGTTATWGDQAYNVQLSNRRADAVKNLLIKAFGVPEKQLITAGLGHEKDPFARGQDVDANGNFVETEGMKNRRVVVLDAESEIAEQILKDL